MKKIILILSLLFFGGLRSMESGNNNNNNNKNNNTKKYNYGTLSKDTKKIVLDFFVNNQISDALKSIMTYKIFSFNNHIEQIEFSPDNRFLVLINVRNINVNTKEYILNVIDIEKNEFKWSISKMNMNCNFSISSDSKFLVHIQNEKNNCKNLMIFELETGKFLWSPEIKISTFAISADGSIIAMRNCEDSKLYVFDLKDGQLIWQSDFKIEDESLKLTSDYIVLKELIDIGTNSDTGILNLISLKDGKIISHKSVNDRFSHIRIESIYNGLILINDGEKLLIWNLETNDFQTFDAKSDYFIDNEKKLIVLVNKNKLTIKNLENNKVLWEIDNLYSCSFEISIDKKYIFMIEDGQNDAKNQLTKRNLETGEIIETFDENVDDFVLTSNALIPDNKFLVIAKDNRLKIKVINLQNRNYWEQEEKEPGCTHGCPFTIIDKEHVYVRLYCDGSFLHTIYKLNDGKIVFKDKNNIPKMNFDGPYFYSPQKVGNINISFNRMKFLSEVYNFDMHQVELVCDIYNMNNLIKQKHNGQGIDISNKSYKVWLTEKQKEIFYNLPQFFQTALLQNFNWLRKSFGIKRNNNNNNNNSYDELNYHRRNKCNIQ